VDDAIFMLENIFRHMNKDRTLRLPWTDPGNWIHHRVDDPVAGRRLYPGAVHARRAGTFVREFSVTICVAILISGIVSVTLTRCVQPFLRVPPHASRGRLFRASEAFLEWMLRVYDRTLQVCLAAPRRNHAGFLLCSPVLLDVSGDSKGFIPIRDTNQMPG